MSVKVIAGPKVYFIGRQQVDEAELSRFLADEGVESWATDTEVAGQKLVETAGRLCYLSFARPRPGGNAAYIGHLLEVGHGSVLEHAVFNLIITGVSRSFTHELVRHRAGFGFSQLSQRYVDESDTAFVVPPLVQRLSRENPWLTERFERYMDAAREAYTDLADDLSDLLTTEAYLNSGDTDLYRTDDEEDIDLALRWLKRQPGEIKTSLRKAAREAARSVLPNATETKIFVTANARALRHFVEMRADPVADAEMRRVALAVLAVLQAEAGNLFGDYVVGGDPPHVTTPHRKV